MQISDICGNVVEKNEKLWQNCEFFPDLWVKVCIVEENVGEIGGFGISFGKMGIFGRFFGEF